jgi:hypothetical protein
LLRHKTNDAGVYIYVVCAGKGLETTYLLVMLLRNNHSAERNKNRDTYRRFGK